MTRRTIILSTLAFFCLIGTRSYSFAQESVWHRSPEQEMRQAMDLFNKEKYAAARLAFFRLMHRDDITDQPLMASEAAYHEALCALELFNEDSRDLLTAFVEEHPNNNRNNMVHFNLALSEYQKKHYRVAIKHFDEVNLRELEKDQIYEYHFKKGYSYLKEEQPAKAKAEFAKVKDSKSRYAAPVNYYYAHLAYVEGDYTEALEGFNKIRDDKTFKAVVPHYITQIHYRSGDWDAVIADAPALLADGGGSRASELNRMIGDAYFYQERYAEAVPYLEKSAGAPGSRPSRTDQYQLGMALYRSGDYIGSIPWLQRVTGPEDSLSQNAYYHLGNSFIQTGKKDFGRTAFLSAYKLKQDITITEDALFNYAKLAYELSYNPFNEAIRALQEYIREYPASKRLDEAYGYLVDLFLSTRNYQGALDALGNISRLTPELREAYQRVAYYQGIEEYNARNYAQSISLFHKSQEFETNRSISALSLYWTAEAYFQQKEYSKARTYYERFLTSPGAFGQDIYPLAHYAIGYTWFKQKEYGQALTSFRKFLSAPGTAGLKMIADARIRAGDCSFIRKDYAAALPFYEEAIRADVIDQDYALYQKAMAQGVLDRTQDKVSSLQQLAEKYPRSPYRDDALFELGNTWLMVQEDEKALNTLRTVTQEYPGSSYEKQALLKIGLILYNRQLDDQAIATLRKVVDEHPGTVEAREALATLRNIYVELNRTEEFFAYTSGLSFASVSNREQDSITYLAAENQYMQGNRDAALNGFNTYLDRFPSGMYKTAANFYRSECLFAQGKTDQALGGYEEVLKRNSAFNETALLRASGILFGKKAYARALAYYEELSQKAEYPNNILIAQTGMMRCRHFLGQDEKALESARKVLESDKAGEQLLVEAHLISAKSRLALGDTTSAETSFAVTSRLDKGTMGAEAKYWSAYILYARGQFEKSEDMCFELINQYPSHDHWMARAFILLSDIYAARDNLFQAKQTLQSVIDNHKGEELVTLAREKLRRIEQQETRANEPAQAPPAGEDFDEIF
jgi:TolA-binding protein